MKKPSENLVEKTKYPEITLKGWDRVPCKAVIYQIVPIGNDQWAADVAIFVEKPTGHPTKDKAFQIPLSIVQKTPEMVFVYLQALGPLFINTVDTVIVYNKQYVPVKTYKLSLGTEEQGINIHVDDYIETLTKHNKFVSDEPSVEDIKEKESDNEFRVKATNVGPKTRQ
ncbi:MAG TPA: hypothetical protein VEP90_17295 [Methylomirabilota bacterium]|nr:hypothetical protein [Methylomirabilota bacterium]